MATKTWGSVTFRVRKVVHYRDFIDATFSCLGIEPPKMWESEDWRGPANDNHGKDASD